MISVEAILRTNLHSKSVKKDFLAKLTDYLTQLFETEPKHIILELHTDVVMMRAGNTDSMLNMNLYHNSTSITQETKHAYASKIAQFMSKEIKVPEQRVLVLFIDTSKCTRY
ncbi:uncharacterized protein LOC121374239 [Gigantopelta aegis]|uniref:uncharacterized protein LOC121374239 n=1 Tax=Gigantopelta aegis TaxID=1735272 RepID=UPI001B888157|nr:uncharacterized protein LOC121374239 [Gigantopelta aegis]XP_041357185.1 uncharacterized protein LOC121374239 [Gigantopelta aegis]